MRLIDADAINWDKAEDCNGNPVYVLDKRDIDNEPTAYDIDKVVEELDNYLTQLVGRNAKLYTTVTEIVKVGGVNE